MEQVENECDGTRVTRKVTEKNVWSSVITQPAVYFTTITDFYQFSTINKCHNLVNPRYICIYLQDPILVQQFPLAAKFCTTQNWYLQFCCYKLSLSGLTGTRPLLKSQTTDKMQHKVAIFTILNQISLCLRQPESLHAVLLPQRVSFAGAIDAHVQTPSFLKYSCK